MYVTNLSAVEKSMIYTTRSVYTGRYPNLNVGGVIWFRRVWCRLFGHGRLGSFADSKYCAVCGMDERNIQDDRSNK